MSRFTLFSLAVAVCLCGARVTAAQARVPHQSVSPTWQPSASIQHIDQSARVTSFQASQRSNRLVWGGLVIGAGVGALLGAAWGKHVDKQQVCPASGPCGGRSNAGPYALVGAALGGAFGATAGWIARHR